MHVELAKYTKYMPVTLEGNFKVVCHFLKRKKQKNATASFHGK